MTSIGWMYFYYNPRPSHLDPELKSIIGLPNFPSYTSGHSTFSGAAAEILSYLFPDNRAEFERLKDEASVSRLYGGIHYRSDLEVGKEHGKRLAGYTVRFALTDGADLSFRTMPTGKTRTGPNTKTPTTPNAKTNPIGVLVRQYASSLSI